MDKSKSKYTFGSMLRQLKTGIIDQNPTFVQVLGMCPTLATTTSVKNAVGMGLATTAVLACSNLFISLLRKFIPKEVRIAAYIVIISGFVTAVEMLMKAFLPDLNESLGVFIALIVVNCIILARAESFASKNGLLASAADGLFTGLGFTLALTLMGAVREILGAGAIFGKKLWDFQIGFFASSAGAFFTYAIFIALFALISFKIETHKKKKAEQLSALDNENTEKEAE